MDITELNLLNAVECVVPSYTIDPMHRRIDLIFLNDSKVMIIGNADNNYVFWVSITRTNDKEWNEKIFNYLVSTDMKQVSSLYKVLQENNYDYSEVSNKYRCFLNKISKTEWDTPFGYKYQIRDELNMGLFFARDLEQYKNELLLRCKARSAEGKYIIVLERYFEILQKNMDNYDNVKVLIDMIKSERYLLLSDETELNMKYHELLAISEHIYLDYMKKQR